MSHAVKIIITTFLFSLTFSPLPCLSHPVSIIAQGETKNNEKTQAEQLLKEANQLAQDPNQVIQALYKYTEAIKIYRQQGDKSGEMTALKQMETALDSAKPIAEQKIKEINQKKADFLKNYPKVENNSTAIKFQELVAQKFGTLMRVTKEDKGKLSPSPTAQKSWNEIQIPLRIYINKLIETPTNEVTKNPSNLRKYLTDNADNLAELRRLILNSEPIRWSVDLTWIDQGDMTIPLPTYLGLVNLENILLLDSLEKSRLGQTKEMLESLEVSFKINESLSNDPTIIGQLVSLIIAKNQAVFLRKLDKVPSEWQQRLLQHDYRQSILPSLYGESYLWVSFFLKNQSRDFDYKEFFGDDFSLFNTSVKSVGFEQWSESLRQNYLSWFAINNIESQHKIYQQLPQENVCTFNKDAFLKKLNIQKDVDWVASWMSQWVKGGRGMLNLELTQKVLEVKEMAAKNGSFPPSLKPMYSSICPGVKWVYEVSPDGKTMSINLSPQFPWISQEQKLPLTYSQKIK